MALKVVFLLAFAVALAYGLPATDSSEKSGSDLLLPVTIDRVIDEIVPGPGGNASLNLEKSNIEAENGPVREKRACRTIQYRSKSGRIISARRC